MVSKFKKILLGGAVALSILLPSSASKSYEAGPMEDPSSHPVITMEAIENYNESASLELRINQDARQKMIEGSILEDHTVIDRSVHHFEPGILGFSPASEWAVSPEEQREVTEGNQTWQRAIDDLRSIRQPSRALGHVIHLIEDMLLPAHTRRDIHILKGMGIELGSGIKLSRIGDFYEYIAGYHLEWMSGVQAYNVGQFNSLEELFADASNFTRENFFSDDTIPNAYELQDLQTERIDRKVYYTRIIDGKKIYVARESWRGNVIDEKCAESMAAVLLPRAVGYVRAAIDLAYKEAGLTNHDCIPLQEECCNDEICQYDSCDNLLHKTECSSNQYCLNGRCITRNENCEVSPCGGEYTGGCPEGCTVSLQLDNISYCGVTCTSGSDCNNFLGEVCVGNTFLGEEIIEGHCSLIQGCGSDNDCPNGSICLNGENPIIKKYQNGSIYLFNYCINQECTDLKK